MQYLTRLLEFTLLSADGEVGRVTDAIFDDESWTIRYFVVKTGSWLSGRRVVVAPEAIKAVDDEADTLVSSLDRKVIAKSPEIDLDQPISLAQAIELHTYYNWPFFWDVVSDEALGTGNLAAVPLVDSVDEMAKEAAEEMETQGGVGERNLRSFKEVVGYRIQARDGEIGQVKDFILEERTWNIFYMVVDTGGLLSEKDVILSPSWVERVDWDNKLIWMDLKRETVRNSPLIEDDLPIDRSFETKLYDHYHKNKYWEEMD